MTDSPLKTSRDPLSAASAPAGACRLLVLAIVPLVAFMALAHTTIEGSSASSMTPADVDERAAQWIIVAVLWVLPVALAGVAFAIIAARLGGRVPPAALTGLGLALLAAHVATQATVVWSDDSTTLADSTIYSLAILLSLLGWWVIDLVAALTCLRLYKSRLAPKTSMTVGVLTILFLLGEVAVYLPALVGSAELHDTIGLPPMLLPVLWAILGGVLLRTRARASA